MGIKTYQEKNTKPMETELAQLDLPVKKKSKKLPEKSTFLENRFADV